MKILRAALLSALALSLAVIACDWLGGRQEPELDGTNQTDAGKPYHPRFISAPDTQRHVAFGLVADTHLDCSYANLVPHAVWWPPFVEWDYCYRDTDNAKHNRRVADKLNIDAGSAGCLGIIHLGDMGNSNNAQNLVAFRQIYERNYPGYDGGAIAGVSDDEHTAYSQGHAILHKSVYPTIGNHDDPPYSDDPKDWRVALQYLSDLIEGADGIISCHDHALSGAYAWRWGRYLFVQLGTWAGSDENESSTYVDTLKLNWLEDLLATYAGDSLGVIVCQHYGWDDFSKEDRWWSAEMRDIETNVLCRQDWRLPDSLQGPVDPYNVICIFSGHCHSFEHHHHTAGVTAEGDTVVFDNFCINDAEGDGSYGYSIATLTGSELKLHTWDSRSGWRWDYLPYELSPW